MKFIKIDTIYNEKVLNVLENSIYALFQPIFTNKIEVFICPPQ